MEFEDSRRLTGPNPLTPGPGATLDLWLPEAQQDAYLRAWRGACGRLLDVLGWDERTIHEHRYQDGLSLTLDAPIDRLYATTEVNEWAHAAAAEALGGDPAPTLTETAQRIREMAAEEANPELLALADEAARREVTLLWDDDEVSLGLGPHARTWPARSLPEPAELSWGGYRDIPVGMITGTNGKTTATRYAAAIITADGRTPGLTSTDWVRVGDRVLDRGDYSGPGGARTVLRHPDCQVALLETARGGLRRRGLAVDHARAALITNIAEDHLGDFGVPDVHALLDIKWTVTRALGNEGLLVLNADDPLLCARAQSARCPIAWYSTHADDGTVNAHVRDGGLAGRLYDDHLELFLDGRWQRLMPAAEVALSAGGHARHNLSNALGAALLCHALGAGRAAIARGLASVSTDDNPGRCSLFEVQGAQVLVDFAHNPHGLEALFDLAAEIPAERRLMLLGQAGDRSDEAIRELAREAWALNLEEVVLKEMAVYRRGRDEGEVAGLLKEALLEAGAATDQITYIADEPAATDHLLDRSRPGDLIILLVHEEIDAVIERVQRRVDAG